MRVMGGAAIIDLKGSFSDVRLKPAEVLMIKMKASESGTNGTS